MEKAEIREIYSHLENFSGKEIEVSGWVKSVRASKEFGFIDLMDGTCFKSCQVVFFANSDVNFDEVSKLNTGSTIIVKGKVLLTPENKQPFEIQAQSVDIFCKTDETYPLQKKRHSIEYLREMVRSVNVTEVSDEEYLSDNVYRYDAETDSFEIA